MLDHVFIIRLDDKDFCVTSSANEAIEYCRKLDTLPTVEHINTENRSHSTTFQYRFKKGN